jgi:hypothetical protein
VVRIAVTAETFDAIAATLPLGNVGYEAELNEKGERQIWIERPWLNKLDAMRGPGDSYSDVILRLVALETSGSR